jgi:hypothetical protein
MCDVCPHHTPMTYALLNQPSGTTDKLPPHITKARSTYVVKCNYQVGNTRSFAAFQWGSLTSGKYSGASVMCSRLGSTLGKRASGLRCTALA